MVEKLDSIENDTKDDRRFKSDILRENRFLIC